MGHLWVCVYPGQMAVAKHPESWGADHTDYGRKGYGDEVGGGSLKKEADKGTLWRDNNVVFLGKDLDGTGVCTIKIHLKVRLRFVHFTSTHKTLNMC